MHKSNLYFVFNFIVKADAANKIIVIEMKTRSLIVRHCVINLVFKKKFFMKIKVIKFKYTHNNINIAFSSYKS